MASAVWSSGLCKTSALSTWSSCIFSSAFSASELKSDPTASLVLLFHTPANSQSSSKAMKTSTHNGARKKLPFFSFGGARPPPNSNMNLNPNVPGSGPQNSENSSEPMGAGAGAGTSSAVLRGSETDDEWYIPYKGPYELPSTPSSGYYRGPQRAQSASSSNVLPPSRSRSAAMASSSLRRSRSRDSWGDPIYPAGDSAADESGYARDEAPTTGAELDRRGRSRAGRGRDMDSDRGRRSGSLTVAISKSRLPGFNAAFVNDSVGGNAVNSEVKTRTWKNEDKEIEDKGKQSKSQTCLPCQLIDAWHYSIISVLSISTLISFPETSALHCFTCFLVLVASPF